MWWCWIDDGAVCGACLTSKLGHVGWGFRGRRGRDGMAMNGWGKQEERKKIGEKEKEEKEAL